MKRTKKEIEKAIDGSFGIISVIAKRLGMSRNGLYGVLARTPELDKAVKDEREKLVDAAEAKLATLVNNGDFHAIQMVLEKMGRSRGWGNEQTVNLRTDQIQQPIFNFVGNSDAKDNA